MVPWREGDPIGFPEHDLEVVHEVHGVLGDGVAQMPDNYHTYNNMATYPTDSEGFAT